MNDMDTRRYQITAVLGKGGNGKVYRAVLRGAGGFSKDVAIKLMCNEDVPEIAIRRFRDEARILGLVRDRAIVNVDPPTRLAGRWAVVMEYVDGASLQQLMKLGPMPPQVVAEIVQEVARALDKVYRQPGPNGEPLRLLHRDIKPANIQVTPDGEVKILDFGIAKADFESREAETRAYIGGTRGFIAPERLEGIDGPEADIFSLGVTAHWLLLGKRPTRRQMMGLEPPDPEHLDREGRRMLSLATQMRSVRIDNRPSARDVEELCAELCRHAKGPSLRRWAETEVPHASTLPTDEMVGSVLTETLAVLPTDERLSGGHVLLPTGERPRRGRRRSGWRLLPYAMAGSVLTTAAIVGLGSIGTALLLLVTSDDLLSPLSPPSTEARPDFAPAPPEAPGSVPVPEASTVPAAPRPRTRPRPTPAQGEPAARSGAPAALPDADAQPAEVEPADPADAQPAEVEPAEVEPADPAEVQRPAPGPPPVALQPITVSSVPLGADLFLDGERLGQTPLLEHLVTPGPHQLRLVSDSETTIRTIEVGRRTPIRYVWKGGDTWEDHF